MEHNCIYCGRDFTDGYSKDYCSEACWECDTDYGNDEE